MYDILLVVLAICCFKLCLCIWVTFEVYLHFYFELCHEKPIFFLSIRQSKTQSGLLIHRVSPLKKNE